MFFDISNDDFPRLMTKALKLRENAAIPHHHSDKPNHKQVRGIVQIEKPLHVLPFSSFAVVLL